VNRRVILEVVNSVNIKSAAISVKKLVIVNRLRADKQRAWAGYPNISPRYSRVTFDLNPHREAFDLSSTPRALQPISRAKDTFTAAIQNVSV
jgi:hypothetical protein